MVLKCFLDIHDDAIPEARYALDALLDTAGFGWASVSSSANADLIYSTERPQESCIWIPATSERNWLEITPSVEIVNDTGLVTPSDVVSTAVEAEIPGDIVLSTFLLLAGQLEKIAPKNSFGVPIARKHPLAIKGLFRIPLVNLYAGILADAILRRSNVKPVSLWPDRQAFGLALTHDVDTPYSRPLASYYRRRLRQDISLRRWGRIPRAIAASVRNSARRSSHQQSPPEDDPNFGFAGWLEFSSGLGIASCFFAASVDSAHKRGVLHDVNYNLDDPFLGPALREVVRAGHEVGLHASIRSNEKTEWLREEKLRLETVLDGPVHGVRHHYWSISGDNPNETFRKHSQAGFLYDSSLGMNDADGFRRGIAVPFYPYDEQSRQALPLVEIPPTVMDGGIFLQSLSTDASRKALEDHLQTVERFKGLAVLDWHVEQNNPARLNSAGPILKSVLGESLAGRQDVYSATPARIAEWWRKRTSVLRGGR